MNSRRSAFSLIIAGLLCGPFFLITDPRFGFAQPLGQNLIDAANQNWLGTVVGLIGSVIVLIIGLWLLTRRTV